MEWINVNDRLPSYGLLVLVTFPTDGNYKQAYISLGRLYHKEKPYWNIMTTEKSEDYGLNKIHYWMEIPIPEFMHEKSLPTEKG